MRYSKSVGCFYPEDINYPELPDDLIEVTEAEYASAMARAPGETLDVVSGNLVIIPPVPPTEAELHAALVATNTAQKSALLAQATQQINTLQDAVDLDMATADEVTALTAWKKYRVLLNRVDVAGEVEWPEVPNA